MTPCGALMCEYSYISSLRGDIRTSVAGWVNYMRCQNCLSSEARYHLRVCCGSRVDGVVGRFLSHLISFDSSTHIYCTIQYSLEESHAPI